MKHCETGQGKATMILPRYLSVETKRARYTKDMCEASEVHEREDENKFPILLYVWNKINAFLKYLNRATLLFLQSITRAFR